MKIKNLLIVLSVLVLGGLVLTQSAYAFWPFDLLKKDQGQEEQVQGGGPRNGFSALVEKLAERFNLNQGEVEAVFEEHGQERKQNMAAHFEERLAQLVSEGKLTEEQKAAIEAKKQEFQSEREEMRSLSLEERKERMEAHHQEMKTWMEEQGIDIEEVCPDGGRFIGRRGFKVGK